MKAKVVAIIPAVLFTALTGVTLYRVIIGETGSREDWRVFFSIVGFSIIFLFTLILVLRNLKEWHGKI